jgi:ribosomal protein L18
MPIPQVPENLSRGVIDGAVVPWEVTGALRVPELVNNHTEFGGDFALYTTTFVLAMNKDTYDRLPDDLKKVIDDNSGIEAAAMFGRAMDDGDKAGKAIAEKAKAAGIKEVAFDRSGFKYHGRIKALADAAREAGALIACEVEAAAPLQVLEECLQLGVSFGGRGHLGAGRPRGKREVRPAAPSPPRRLECWAEVPSRSDLRHRAGARRAGAARRSAP